MTSAIRRQPQHLRTTLSLASLAMLCGSLIGCGGLNLQLRRHSVKKPSNVALYFSVETRDGAPVAGLAAEAFRIYEDGQLISAFESKQTILNPEEEVVHYTLLLLDLSGSITESGAQQQLVAAASSFAQKVSRKQQVAIYGFDGGAKLIPISGFTGSGSAISRGLSRASTRRSKDPSTNLNGAVVAAVKVLNQRMASSKKPLRFGTLVIFTDGTDRAHRVTADEMYDTLDQAEINVFAIGLGGEISPGQLSRLGGDGFVKADQLDSVGTAFDEVAARIEAAGRRFYLLSYCSPARAGTHDLTVEVSAEGQGGSLTQQFVADGFRPNCNPNQRPSFPIGRITLRRRKR